MEDTDRSPDAHASDDSSPRPPYLTLTIPEAAALPDPPAPEPRRFETFIHLLDHRAQHEANEIAVGFPSCTDKGNKAKCLQWTYVELAHLSRACMRPLKDALGDEATVSERDKQPIVAMLAPSGPEFLLHAVACWRLGAAVMPIALGTTAQGILNLIELTGCRRLLFHEKQAGLAKEVEESRRESEVGRQFRLVKWTEYSAIDKVQKGPAVSPLHTSTPDDTLVVFHSSGSTGNPKPIPQLVRFWTASLKSAAGRDLAAFTTTPLYHGGLSDLFRSLQAAAPIFFFPWHEAKAPIAANIVSSVDACHDDIRFFLSVPFILETLAKDKSGLAMLQRMELVSTGGAPLPEEVGDQLTAQHDVKLVSRMGSSECGFLMSSWRHFDTEKDWSWLRRPKEASTDWLHFEPQDEEPGMFELIVQEKWPTKLLSNRDGGKFETGDLYEQHTEHPERWRYARRADDAIVMVNGKKIASAAVEGHFKASGMVDEVVVFGANRPLLGAFVLPAASSAQANGDREAARRTFLQRMKPALQNMNAKLPSHARIPTEMLYIADAAFFEDLPKSSKGTLQRGMALQKLDPVISQIYSRFEEGEAHSTEPRRKLEQKGLRDWLSETISEIVGHSVGEEQDFFQSGVDSIMAARIRAAVHQHIDMDGRKLSPNAIYENPTITLLAAHIEGAESQDIANGDDARKVAQDMVSRYSWKRSRPTQKRRALASGATVLLTGATGALGARVLEKLCRVPNVEAIVCLVRAADHDAATQRIQKSLIDKRCTIGNDVFRQKVKCVSALEENVAARLGPAERLVIIHCAWTVNFALRLESFEKECIAPLHDLLELYASSKNPASFVFCSSVASVLAGQAPHREAASSDVADAGATGYGQSKWVAEHICDSYRDAAGLPVTVARVGQLCGDTQNGIWNETEAWPLLVRTANETGLLPRQGPDVDWLPVDIAASSIVDLGLADYCSPVAHVTLPQRQARLSWQDFLAGLGKGGLAFKPVPKEDWLKSVKEAGTRVRGRALLDIWEKMPEHGQEPTVETSKTEEASPSLHSAQCISIDLVARFITAWQASGFLK